MPATTAKGWPYVLPTDNVADYPVTSQGLANKLEAAVPFAMATGAGSFSNPGVTATQIRPFPVGLFTVPPIVMVTKTGGNGGGRHLLYSQAISTVDFTVVTNATDGVFAYAGVIGYQWLAIQMTPTIAFSEDMDPAALAELEAAMASVDDTTEMEHQT